jgi:hypothetical protein
VANTSRSPPAISTVVLNELEARRRCVANCFCSAGRAVVGPVDLMALLLVSGWFGDSSVLVTASSAESGCASNGVPSARQ